ncbi:MAG TPA: SCO family protein [Vicinamibacterales bacterium]|nr:SCO family protein [Vicinamibacterales bacterium]
MLGAVTWSPAQTKEYTINGMVLRVDPARRSFLVSHDAVPGLMAAMTMSFDVRDAKELTGVQPGNAVTFTLAVGQQSMRAERVRVVPYRSVEQDPLTARRLALLKSLSAAPKPLTVGGMVPDFTLTDQARRQVRLSQFRGKVVALNFIYTSCALPQFCYRVANHFGVVQRRFRREAGREVVFLTVTFDPLRDTPEKLAEYAAQWNADPDVWHFLTGEAAAVRRVCNVFGVDFFPDEGLMNHSIRTAVIDRQGTLVANIEGNQYSAAQLGDLVETTLRR